MLEQLIIIIHILAAVAVIGLILLQQGKGADMGASFGSGASQTVLGVQGGGNLLTHATAILTTVFFITSISLGYFAKQKSTVSPDQDIIIQELQKTADAVKNDEVPVVAPVAAAAQAPAAQNSQDNTESQVQVPVENTPVNAAAPDNATPVKDEIPE